MKYIVVLGDGMADRPIEELGNKTPIEYANTPMMDELAKMGEIGLCATVPKGLKPGSDIANLAVLGYNPAQYYSGRSPLEALSIGAPMKDTDVALRVNVITVKDPKGEGSAFEDLIIEDHSSGEISTEEAAILMEEVKKAFEGDEFSFYVGTSYRHCCLWNNGKVLDLAQPHDHLGERVGDYLPEDTEDGLKFADMMRKSYEILKDHPINKERIANGKNPANSLWFWGAGTKPALSPFIDKTHKKGVMISATDLLKGIGSGAGMEVIKVEGANGQLETNYEGKAKAAVDALLKDGYDFAYIHVEAPDEMGHQGSVERKVKAIEYLDQRLIKIVYEQMKGTDYRMLVMPDHPTPICIRTHSDEAVPYILFDSRKIQNNEWNYSEKNAKLSGNLVDPGYQMIDKLLGE